MRGPLGCRASMSAKKSERSDVDRRKDPGAQCFRVCVASCAVRCSARVVVVVVGAAIVEAMRAWE